MKLAMRSWAIIGLLIVCATALVIYASFKTPTDPAVRTGYFIGLFTILAVMSAQAAFTLWLIANSKRLEKKFVKMFPKPLKVKRFYGMRFLGGLALFIITTPLAGLWFWEEYRNGLSISLFKNVYAGSVFCLSHSFGWFFYLVIAIAGLLLFWTASVPYVYQQKSKYVAFLVFFMPLFIVFPFLSYALMHWLLCAS